MIFFLGGMGDGGRGRWGSVLNTRAAIYFIHDKGVHGQGKSQGKKYFLKARELSGNFEICQGILEFKQKSGNFEITSLFK